MVYLCCSIEIVCMLQKIILHSTIMRMFFCLLNALVEESSLLLVKKHATKYKLIKYTKEK